MSIQIDIVLPSGWAELSQRQLGRLYQIMVDVQGALAYRNFESQQQYTDAEKAQVKTLFFLGIARMQVLCRYGKDFLVRIRDKEGVLSPDVVAAAISALDWVEQVPDRPVILQNIAGVSCRYRPDIEGMTLEIWLALENLWTGYIATQQDTILDQMIALLYPDIDKKKIMPRHRLSVVFFWAAVKNMISELFPDFFSGDTASGAHDAVALQRNVNNIIRALTKGDVTKERQVLTLDVYRALAELDAQAREAKDLERKYGK